MKKLRFRQIVWLDLKHMVKLEELAVKADLPHNVLISKIIEVVLDDKDLLDKVLSKISKEEGEKGDQNIGQTVTPLPTVSLWECPYCKRLYWDKREAIECWKSHLKKKK